MALSPQPAEDGTDDGGHLSPRTQNYAQPTAHMAFPPSDLQESKTLRIYFNPTWLPEAQEVLLDS